MIFNLLILFQIVSLISGSNYDLFDNEKTKVLITSATGFQYSKTRDFYGWTNITYDCIEGPKDKGTVNLMDEYHPIRIKFLTIQNCKNIKVIFSHPKTDYFELKYLKIRNTNNVTIDHQYNYDSFYKNTIDVDIRGIEFLEIKKLSFWQVSLKIQQIQFLNIENHAMRSNVIKLELNEVKEGEIDYESILMFNETGILEIKNSNFKIISKNGLSFKGFSVNIHNNSFENLHEMSFSLEADTMVTIKNNYFKDVQNSFKITSPNVQIVSNVFHKIEYPWLSNIFITSDEKLGILNISKNTMNILPPGFLSLNPENKPDMFFFKNNYFNCSCKYWNLLNSTNVKDYSDNLFLYNKANNICLNLDNCSLYKVLSNMSAVCHEEFVCSQQKKSDTSIFSSLLLAINDLSQKLNSFNLITDTRS